MFMGNKIPVIIDDNPDLGYEKTRWWYPLMVPIILLLAFYVAIKKKILGPNLKTNTFWFDGICSVCREIKENATNWVALDNLYNYQFKKDISLKGKINDFWENGVLNAKAMRNRLRLVKKLLRENIEDLYIKYKEIRLISIASGSAQGIIEAMKEFKQRGVLTKAIFLDIDVLAIEHSQELAQESWVINQITFVNKRTRELEEVARGFNPNMVEVVGFLEYRPKERAIELVRRVYHLLTPSGVLLISSISPNIEKLFVHYVINWPMFYRNLKQFTEIITEGGFEPKNIKIIYEPLKIQKIAVCRKSI